MRDAPTGQQAPGPYRAPSCRDCGASTRIAAGGRCAGCLEDALTSAKELLRSAHAFDRQRFGSPWRAIITTALTFFTIAIGGWSVGHAVAKAEHLGARTSAAATAREPDQEVEVAPPLELVATPFTLPGDRGTSYPQDTPSGPVPWPPHILSTAGPLSDDPHELLARAERLQAAGLGVTIAHTTVDPTEIVRVRTLRTLPLIQPDGGVFGFKLYGLDRALERAGLAEGDVITAVNGRDLARDPHAMSQRLADTGLAIVEVLRGERRIVLAVHWRRGHGAW